MQEAVQQCGSRKRGRTRKGSSLDGRPDSRKRRQKRCPWNPAQDTIRRVVVANEIPRRLRRAQAVPHAFRPQTHPSVPTPFATARSEPPIATARSRRPRLGAPAAGRRPRSAPAMDAPATRRDERRVRGVPHRIRRPAQGGAGLGDLAALCAVEEGAGG